MTGGAAFPPEAIKQAKAELRTAILARRDAADVAMTTSYGALRLERMTVWADEVHPELADDGLVPPPPGLTVSGVESGGQ